MYRCSLLTWDRSTKVKGKSPKINTIWEKFFTFKHSCTLTLANQTWKCSWGCGVFTGVHWLTRVLTQLMFDPVMALIPHDIFREPNLIVKSIRVEVTHRPAGSLWKPVYFKCVFGYRIWLKYSWSRMNWLCHKVLIMLITPKIVLITHNKAKPTEVIQVNWS